MPAADNAGSRLADHLGLREEQGTRVKRFGEIELKITGSDKSSAIEVHAGLARWLDTYQVA
ncbi:MAG TPA: hypothetical protein VIU61_25965, partial [Kofleriaceae bacterium]